LKILFLFSVLSSLLLSEMINGIAIRVNGKGITTYDIENSVKKFGVAKSEVVRILIREILENGEIKKYKLDIPEDEFDSFLNNFLAQRRIPSKEVFFQQLSANGIQKEDFLKKMKNEAIRPKLYRVLSSGKIGTPLENELKDFFNKNRKLYNSGGKYEITIYSSASLEAIQQKISNPLLLSPNVSVQDQVLEFNQLNQNMQQMLSSLDVGSYSQPIQNGNGYAILYLKDIQMSDEVSFETVKAKVENDYYRQEQMKFINRHFQKLEENAIIEYIR
jgi:hypothetical protein